MSGQDSTHKLAQDIAYELFTNGFGQRAERLVLTQDGPPKRDLGGWSESVLADKIEQFLIGWAEGRG